jgi:mycofactocin precursor
MPYSLPHRPEVSSLTQRKVNTMEQDQQVAAPETLVTESLVEEVSIDGMCGVY